MKISTNFRFFLLAYSLWCAFGAYGQEVSHAPKHVIKFSPLHLVNPELASVQVAYEYRFAPTFSVQVEGGYVFGDVWWSYASADTRGFKLKQDVRWYIKNKDVVKRSGKTANKGLYLALDFHQNRITLLRNEPQVYRQSGIGIKTGFIRHATWGFVIDMNVGLTAAHTNMFPFGIPLDNTNEAAELGGYVVLPIVGLRLGQVLR